MGRFLNPDNTAFKKITNGEIYVDKSGLIEFTNRVSNTPQCFICSSRPRRFGKSFAAEMLAAYYSKGCDSRDLFSNLSIAGSADYEKYLNKCNVIHLDIQWFLSTTGDAQNLVDNISKEVNRELADAFPGIAEEADSLPEVLSGISGRTGEQFVIIIDEWDVLIRDESQDKKAQEKYINFLRGMFKGSEPSKYLQLVYLTGILPIKRQKTQSALNNFNEYTMVSPGNLAPYIGFTETEVKKLCAEYMMDYAEVKRWYDGYLLGRYQIYNPNAVVQSMIRHELGSYWTSTASYSAIVPYINMNFDGLKQSVIAMLSGSSIEVDVNSFQNDVDMRSFSNKDDILTLLIHLGYLAYDRQRAACFIPNEEIRLELLRAVKAGRWTAFDSFMRESAELLDATLDGEEKQVAGYIEEMHNTYASDIRYHDENSLASVLTIGYLCTLQYYFKPVRELPTGRGFADLVYLPKPEYRPGYPAMLVELKWNKSANTAIDQIKDRKYPESLRQYTGDILLVGINYNKKKKEHTCRIERLMMQK